MFRIKINHSNSNNIVATIGNFDGVHLGHLQIFNKLDKNCKRLAITFEPLPSEYFMVNPQIKRLSLIRDKSLLLNNYIDELIILKFNHHLAYESAQSFANNFLIKTLKIDSLVVGYDFKFGKDANGDINLLKDLIPTTVVKPYYINDSRVSSSLIRQYAAKNSLDKVKTYLGRNLQYTSRVVYGKQLGRKYGVPTINLSLGNHCPAVWGIYMAHVYIESICYDAIASIGYNPTVSETKLYKLEAHLLNIDLNLYGKIATVEILEFVRHEMKFTDLTSLFKQIHQDLDKANAFFKVKNGLQKYNKSV